MNPEEEAREVIDGLLEAAGWQVQDFHGLNFCRSLAGGRLATVCREDK